MNVTVDCFLTGTHIRNIFTWCISFSQHTNRPLRHLPRRRGFLELQISVCFIFLYLASPMQSNAGQLFFSNTWFHMTQSQPMLQWWIYYRGKQGIQSTTLFVSADTPSTIIPDLQILGHLPWVLQRGHDPNHSSVADQTSMYSSRSGEWGAFPCNMDEGIGSWKE